jgi:hypothetical protein
MIDVGAFGVYIRGMEPAPPRFQYSLWSLSVLTTFVAVICSIAVTTRGIAVPVIIAGIAVCLLGFGPLSYRKHPDARFFTIVLGFLVRLVGLVILAFGVFLWLAMGVGRGR